MTTACTATAVTTERIVAADGSRLTIQTKLVDGFLTVEIYRGHSRTNQLLTKAAPIMAGEFTATSEAR